MQIGVFRIMLQLREKPLIWEEFMSMQLGYNIQFSKEVRGEGQQQWIIRHRIAHKILKSLLLFQKVYHQVFNDNNQDNSSDI